MTGSEIRNFFRELLGSRLIERLEVDLQMQRVDFDLRLQDKEYVIADLRMEKQQLLSKIALYELTIMPRASVQGAEVVGYQKPTKPNFSKEMFLSPPPMSSWQKVQFEHEERMKREVEEEEKAKTVPTAT